MDNETLCKNCGAPNSPSATFCTQCGASMSNPPARKQRRLKKRYILGGFIVFILICAVIAAITPNNTTTTTELITATPKAITTPTATPAHDAVLSKYLDVYHDASNTGGTKVTAWQVTWLSGNSVKLQKSTITSLSGTNQKLTETDVITRFASASEASNYVQSHLGTAAYHKTLAAPFYTECTAYKQLTGQQPTICANYDTSISGNGNGNGKAITQANEIVTISDYVSVVA